MTDMKKRIEEANRKMVEEGRNKIPGPLPFNGEFKTGQIFSIRNTATRRALTVVCAENAGEQGCVFCFVPDTESITSRWDIVVPPEESIWGCEFSIEVWNRIFIDDKDLQYKYTLLGSLKGDALAAFAELYIEYISPKKGKKKKFLDYRGEIADPSDPDLALRQDRNRDEVKRFLFDPSSSQMDDEELYKLFSSDPALEAHEIITEDRYLR